MSSDTDILDHCQQVLAELVESDLEVVRHVKAHLLEQHERVEVDSAMRSYARASRSLRQSVALTQKLARDVARDGREIAAAKLREAILHRPAPAFETTARSFPADIPAANQRAHDLRMAVGRLIWSEGLDQSDVSAERLLEGECFRRLEDWIHDERCEDAFVDQPLDDHVAEYCAELGLNPDKVTTWRDLPEPDAEIVAAYLADHSQYAAAPPWHESG